MRATLVSVTQRLIAPSPASARRRPDLMRTTRPKSVDSNASTLPTSTTARITPVSATAASA